MESNNKVVHLLDCIDRGNGKSFIKAFHDLPEKEDYIYKFMEHIIMKEQIDVYRTFIDDIGEEEINYEYLISFSIDNGKHKMFSHLMQKDNIEIDEYDYVSLLSDAILMEDEFSLKCILDKFEVKKNL